MPYQFRQTGAEIQDILDQVGENTTDIAQNAEDIDALNTTLTHFINLFSATPTAVTAKAGRATNVSGGYIRIGNVIIVQVQFTSTGGNFMAYLDGFPIPRTPNKFAVLSAATSGYTAQMHAVALSDGTVAVTQHTNGDIITVSGAYITAN